MTIKHRHLRSLKDFGNGIQNWTEGRGQPVLTKGIEAIRLISMASSSIYGAGILLKPSCLCQWKRGGGGSPQVSQFLQSAWRILILLAFQRSLFQVVKASCQTNFSGALPHCRNFRFRGGGGAVRLIWVSRIVRLPSCLGQGAPETASFPFTCCTSQQRAIVQIGIIVVISVFLHSGFADAVALEMIFSLLKYSGKCWYNDYSSQEGLRWKVWLEKSQGMVYLGGSESLSS